jgi:hypothetical protein
MALALLHDAVDDTITGRWERGTEPGAPLEHDFGLSYTRVRQ